MEYLNQLEKIIESGHRLITIESDEVERVCNFLLEISHLSTSPYYLAQPEQAMYRFGASHISIPRTQNIGGVIDHIEASKHFGIFILSRHTEIFENDAVVKKLIKIATAEMHKIIIIVAENITVPRKLSLFTVQATHKLKVAV